MLELGLLKSAKSEKNILMICEKNKSLPAFDLNGQLVLRYTFDVPDKKVEYHFKKSLSKWICEVYGKEREMCSNSKQGIFSDAHRLLEKGEYSASIVSAYSELEYQLSLYYMELYPKKDVFSHFRLNDYLKSDIYSDIPFLKEFVSLRNKIVHQRYVATEEEALKFMDFVKEVYDNAQRK